MLILRTLQAAANDNKTTYNNSFREQISRKIHRGSNDRKPLVTHYEQLIQ